MDSLWGFHCGSPIFIILIKCIILRRDHHHHHATARVHIDQHRQRDHHHPHPSALGIVSTGRDGRHTRPLRSTRRAPFVAPVSGPHDRTSAAHAQGIAELYNAPPSLGYRKRHLHNATHKRSSALHFNPITSSSHPIMILRRAEGALIHSTRDADRIVIRVSCALFWRRRHPVIV